MGSWKGRIRKIIRRLLKNPKDCLTCRKDQSRVTTTKGLLLVFVLLSLNERSTLVITGLHRSKYTGLALGKKIYWNYV